MELGYDVLARAIMEHSTAEQLVAAVYAMQEDGGRPDDENMRFAMTTVGVLKDPAATPGTLSVLDMLRQLAQVPLSALNHRVLETAAGLLTRHPLRPRGDDDYVPSAETAGSVLALGPDWITDEAA